MKERISFPQKFHQVTPLGVEKGASAPFSWRVFVEYYVILNKQHAHLNPSIQGSQHTFGAKNLTAAGISFEANSHQSQAQPRTICAPMLGWGLTPGLISAPMLRSAPLFFGDFISDVWDSLRASGSNGGLSRQLPASCSAAARRLPQRVVPPAACQLLAGCLQPAARARCPNKP